MNFLKVTLEEGAFWFPLNSMEYQDYYFLRIYN